MAIMKGDAAGATEVITRKFPWVLASGSDRSPVSKDAQFMLAIQSYIELLRKGNIDQAVQYSQSYLSPLYSSVLGVPDKETLLREVVALIAYEQPELSPLSHLLDPQQQELTADSLNSAILSHHSSKTGLQELLEQLHRVEASLHEVAGNQGTLLPFELLMRNNNNNV